MNATLSRRDIDLSPKCEADDSGLSGFITNKLESEPNAVHLGKDAVSFKVNTMFQGAVLCQAKQQPCSRAFALLIT